jgi:hypothetical protein
MKFLDAGNLVYSLKIHAGIDAKIGAILYLTGPTLDSTRWGSQIG